MLILNLCHLATLLPLSLFPSVFLQSEPVDLFYSQVKDPSILPIILKALPLTSLKFRPRALKEINLMVLRSPDNCELFMKLPGSWQALVLQALSDLPLTNPLGEGQRSFCCSISALLLYFCAVL